MNNDDDITFKGLFSPLTTKKAFLFLSVMSKEVGFLYLLITNAYIFIILRMVFNRYAFIQHIIPLDATVAER